MSEKKVDVIERENGDVVIESGADDSLEEVIETGIEYFNEKVSEVKDLNQATGELIPDDSNIEIENIKLSEEIDDAVGKFKKELESVNDLSLVIASENDLENKDIDGSDIVIEEGGVLNCKNIKFSESSIIVKEGGILKCVGVSLFETDIIIAKGGKLIEDRGISYGFGSSLVDQNMSNVQLIEEDEDLVPIEVNEGKEYKCSAEEIEYFIEGGNFEVSNADLEYIILRLENGDEETSNPDILEVMKKELKKRKESGFDSEDKELLEIEDRDEISADKELTNEEQSEKYASEILKHIGDIFLIGDSLTKRIEDPNIEIKPAIYEIMCECILNIRFEELKYKGKINEDDSRKIDSRIQELCDSYGISYETATRESVQEDLNNHLKYENIFQEIKDKLRMSSDERGQEEEILEETETERVKRESIEELCKNDPIAKEYYESSPDEKRAKIEAGKNEARTELGKDLAEDQKRLGETAEDLKKQREEFQEKMEAAHETFEAQENSLQEICKTAEFKLLDPEQKLEIKRVVNMFRNLAKSHIDLERIMMLEEDMNAMANSDSDALLESFPNYDKSIRTWEGIMDLIDSDIKEIAENEEKALGKWFKWLKENPGDAALILAAIAAVGLGAGILTTMAYGAAPGAFVGIGTGLAGTWAATKTTMSIGLIKSMAIAKTGVAIGAIGGLVVGFLALVDEEHRDKIVEWFTGKSVPAWCRVGKKGKA